MCGIIGVSYGPGGPDSEEWTPEELAQIMFPCIIHRGRHAWGWMSYNEKEDAISVQKYCGAADTPQAMQLMAVDPNAKWWVGHVRYATHGKPELDYNNHPIIHGSIVGVHNGVLRNHEEILKETGREDSRALVDSEAIFAAVFKWGVMDGLKKVRGDMVTVFANANHPKTLYVARSHGRQLYLARTKAGSLIFASEPQVIEATDVRINSMSQIREHRLLKIRNGKIKERLDLPAPIVKQSELVVPRRVVPSLENHMVRGKQQGQRYTGPRRWEQPSQPVPKDKQGKPDYKAWVEQQWVDIMSEYDRKVNDSDA